MISLVPEEGVIVYNHDDENLREVIENTNLKARTISYGKTPSADFVLLESETTFENACFKNYVKADTPFKKDLEFSLAIPGEYNALNALSVLALLYGLDLLDSEWIRAFGSFSGVRRRQEIIWADNGLVIIDDFAHHPTAVEKTLKALKKVIQPEKTVVVFEPRTNSSKRRIFQEDYVRSLGLADEVYLKVPPGLENIPKEERLDTEYLSQALRKTGVKFDFLGEPKLIKKENNKKTLVIFMSSVYFKELERLKSDLLI